MSDPLANEPDDLTQLLSWTEMQVRGLKRQLGHWKDCAVQAERALEEMTDQRDEALDRALRAEHDLNQLTGPLAVGAAKAAREEPEVVEESPSGKWNVTVQQPGETQTMHVAAYNPTPEAERDRADALEEKLRAAEAERDAWLTRWQTAAQRADKAQARAASWWEAAKYWCRENRNAHEDAVAISKLAIKNHKLIDQTRAELDVAQQRVSELEEELAHVTDSAYEDAEDYWALADLAETWREDAETAHRVIAALLVGRRLGNTGADWDNGKPHPA